MSASGANPSPRCQQIRLSSVDAGRRGHRRTVAVHCLPDIPGTSANNNRFPVEREQARVTFIRPWPSSPRSRPTVLGVLPSAAPFEFVTEPATKVR